MSGPVGRLPVVAVAVHLTSTMAMISNMTMTDLPGTLPVPRPRAWRIAAQLPAPAARGATIGELGLLLDVVEYDQGDVHVQLSPAPARSAWHEEICDGLQRLLAEHGYRRVDVELLLAPMTGPARDAVNQARNTLGTALRPGLSWLRRR
ncbi:hypothetical protein [Nocardioides daejeonensis]|uniref:hypothetical protein n=1 Tax=Nocardioides daejeonensis TaxID=1046556 RepID=UPI0013A5B8F5|nr:hypothetical protein [Nocardioides daejeonensis]